MEKHAKGKIAIILCLTVSIAIIANKLKKPPDVSEE